MQNLFFDDWTSLLRAFILTILAYFSLIIVIRLSGKRTLSKMNAFDFLVTIALGSCLASVALNKDIALAEGALVFSTLIALQYFITWLSVRVKFVKKLVTGKPALLFYRGEILEKTLIPERITIEEIYMAARKKGITDLNQIEFMILETTGDITVISKSGNLSDDFETLRNVSGFPDSAE